MDDAVIRTKLTERLGITHPVLCAPMGDSAGGRLAAAVSRAGALGLIGGGYADPDWLAAELANSDGARVGVGFITFALEERPATLGLALDAGIEIVQLSFGDPRPFAERIRAASATLICQVHNEEDVRQAQEAGADVLVAQGRDAGGHGRPDRGTFGFVPSLVDRAGDTPVVAAGGLADGRGLAAALALGASGIAMGTRFLASFEAITQPVEAAGLVAGRAEDTVRTESFDVLRGPPWPAGFDGRALRNEVVRRWGTGLDANTPAFRALSAAFHASAPDDFAMRPLWAGEGLDLVTSIEPAETIVRDVVIEAASILHAVHERLV